MKTYKLSLSVDYVSDWTVCNAVRELLQNAIDGDAPWEVVFDTCANGLQSISIRSKGVSLSASDLVLGVSSKTGDDGKIGHFGEGFKLALVVLLRNGLGVTIQNGGVLWRPFFSYDSDFGTEILHVEEQPLDTNEEFKLDFTISRLSVDEITEIKESCLQLQQREEGKSIPTKYGDILLDKPGKVYVNGLYVCNSEMEYGYNIKPKHITLNRDRKSVAEFNLAWVSKDMWMGTHDPERVAEMIEADVLDVKYAHYSTSESVKEAVIALFEKKFHGKLLAGSQTELKRMVDNGTQCVIVHTSEAFRNIVKSDENYQKAVVDAEMTPTKHLDAWLKDNSKHLRKDGKLKFKQLIAQSKRWMSY